MMKGQLIIFAIISLLMTSCEKVVNIDLNNAAAQYVIEANLYEGINDFKVHVAKTTDYYGRAPQQQISDAVVTLVEPSGNLLNIPSVGNGWYELPDYNAIAANTYQLKVAVSGNEFTASSTIPGIVPIDSVVYEFKTASGFQEEGYEVTGYFTDPADKANFYRVLLNINDTLQNEPGNLNLFRDKYNNGRLTTIDLFRRFETGDKLDMELRSMDEQVFEFYTSLSDALNNQGGPAPANPNTNIKGGALGYFGAISVSKRSITFP